jgi:hypothetical protein
MDLQPKTKTQSQTPITLFYFTAKNLFCNGPINVILFIAEP